MWIGMLHNGIEIVKPSRAKPSQAKPCDVFVIDGAQILLEQTKFFHA